MHPRTPPPPTHTHARTLTPHPKIACTPSPSVLTSWNALYKITLITTNPRTTTQVIFLGYIVAKLKLLPPPGKGLSQYLSTIALPSLVFSAMLELDFGTLRWNLVIGIALSRTLIFFVAVRVSDQDDGSTPCIRYTAPSSSSCIRYILHAHLLRGGVSDQIRMMGQQSPYTVYILQGVESHLVFFVGGTYQIRMGQLRSIRCIYGRVFTAVN